MLTAGEQAKSRFFRKNGPPNVPVSFFPNIVSGVAAAFIRNQDQDRICSKRNQDFYQEIRIFVENQDLQRLTERSILLQEKHQMTTIKNQFAKSNEPEVRNGSNHSTRMVRS